MTDPASPLLLVVQMNVAPEHEAAFNDWYHLHIPHLVQAGYTWGRRYRAVYGSVGYLALYAIGDRALLPVLMNPDRAARPAILNEENDKFRQLAGINYYASNVYEQIYGPPFVEALMERDYPLSLVSADCRPDVEQEFNRYYNESHVPNLLRVPGYLSGRRFRVAEDPALMHRPGGAAAKYLALYELKDVASVPGLTDPERQTPEAKAELANWVSTGVSMLTGPTGWNIYRPIAKHWPLRQ